MELKDAREFNRNLQR